MENKDKTTNINYFRSIWGNVLSLLAAMVSWYLNSSVVWAVFHWIVGPLYLVYCIFKGYLSNGNWHKIIDFYFN